MCDVPPKVTTTLGVIEGVCQKLGNEYCDLFLGIPYAQPPVGSLRFENPRPLEKWSNIMEAKKFGSASISHTLWPLSSKQMDQESEDCLKLNIFRPHCEDTIDSKELLSVLVYVHGGGFCAGSSRDYGFQQLCKNFVITKTKFIVVTIQYRLGVFGFLTDGSQNLPGNYGFFDQALAFSFLYQHISAFGGDPQHIVAWGLSAGAASCSALTLSPYSKNFICASIEMSGSVLSAWSCSSQCVTEGKAFLRAICKTDKKSIQLFLNCLNKTNTQIDELFNYKNLKQFLQSKLLEEIQNTVFQLGTSRRGFNLLKYHPRIDGDFFPDNILDLITHNNLTQTKPFLMGLTSCEGLYFTLMAKDQFLNKIFVDAKDFNKFNKLEFQQTVAELIKESENFPTAKHAEAISEICLFYLSKKSLFGKKSDCADYYLEKYTELISDVLFNVASIWTARARAKSGHLVFMYLNEYFNPMQFSSRINNNQSQNTQEIPVHAATHANEYPYIHGLFPVGKFDFNETDLWHQKLLVKMISTFVQNGKPCVDGIRDWPSVSKDELKPISFVLFDSVTSEPRLEKYLKLEESAKFWWNLQEKFHFDLIQNIDYQVKDSV